MECLCRRMASRRVGVNWTAGIKNSTCRRAMSSTGSLRAVKKQPKPAMKTRTVPEYKKPLPPRPSLIIPPKSHNTQPPNPFRYRATPFILGSLLTFGLGGYAAFIYLTIITPSEEAVPTTAAEQADVSAKYDAIAPRFDGEVEWMERMMGITSLRKKLAGLARGDVLEVSIGTGRNLEFYDFCFGSGGHGTAKGQEVLGGLAGRIDGNGKWRGKGEGVRSFTAVDKSPEMLEVAHEKFAAKFPGILGVRWIIADASLPDSIPGPPRNANERSGNREGGYDTIIQTMGLCSVADPVALLRNLGRCVKEGEGRILLLEHGRGRYEWLNGVLDKSAEGHAREFGCWWNRDIGHIVEESGLEIVEVRRPKWWHGGTTWWVELKKPQSPTVAETVKETVVKVEDKVKETAGVATAKGGLEKNTPAIEEEEPKKMIKKKGWW